MLVADQLEKLAGLLEKGLISREQFEEQRDLLIARSRAESVPPHRTTGGPALPERVGAYGIVGHIGDGGMGTVYRGRHRSPEIAARQGGDVAVKVMHPHIARNAAFAERFEREASLGLKLNHPGIVQVHDLVLDGEVLALVMDLVEGKPLSEVIGRQTGPIPWQRAWPMFGQLLDAVSYMHGEGVLHRDIKPENVLVTAEGQLRLLDLGIAKDLAAVGTATGTGMGTIAYMAPEQHTDASRADERADIYALGMTLYEMLAGELPWGDEQDPVSVLHLKISGTIPPPSHFYPEIPPTILPPLLAAIEGDVDRRIPSVAVLRDALSSASAQLGVGDPLTLAPSTGDAESAQTLPPDVSGGARPAQRSVPPRPVAGPGKRQPPGPRGSGGNRVLMLVGISVLIFGVLGICGFGALLVMVSADAPSSAKPAPLPSEVASAIARVPDGGSSSWDSSVSEIMLRHYDHDGSGSLDRASELSSIDCTVWRELDRALSTRFEDGLGFYLDGFFLGYNIKLDRSMQAESQAAVEACASALDFGAVPAVPGGMPRTGQLTDKTSPSSGSAEDRIRGISLPGGHSAWDTEVKSVLLSSYDADRSGDLNDSAEITAVPCSVYRAIDEGAKQNYSSGIRLYVEGLWVGGLLGFDESQQGTILSRIRTCGI